MPLGDYFSHVKSKFKVGENNFDLESIHESQDQMDEEPESIDGKKKDDSSEESEAEKEET